AESQKHQWIDTVSDGRLLLAQGAHWAALALLILVMTGLRGNAPGMAGSAIAGAKDVTVTPGDTSVERGHGLVVLARFTGPLPADAALVVTPSVQNSASNASRSLPLVKNLDDPVFGGSIPEV